MEGTNNNLQEVLALNFPARGRKPEGIYKIGRPEHHPFWPLISPQGDGNPIQPIGTSGEPSVVLALNFPARGRKPGQFFLNQAVHLSEFWPLISPQGDGNRFEGGDHREEAIPGFWPLISPQGDGNDRQERRSPQFEEGFWPLISPQGDGNFVDSMAAAHRRAWFWPLISPQGDGNPPAKTE